MPTIQIQHLLKLNMIEANRVCNPGSIIQIQHLLKLNIISASDYDLYVNGFKYNIC